jgi:dihydroorotate dehydrogenase (NAD+) catalytic subunit
MILLHFFLRIIWFALRTVMEYFGNMNANLKTNFLGIELANPLILASGILGVTKASIRNVAKHGAGAMTMKSISIEPRSGHKNPVVITYEAGMMNAVGYSNPGWKVAKNEFSDLSDIGAPVIASIIGTEPKDFEFLAENFLSEEFAAVEVPLSCPHTPGFGMLAGQGTPQATARITKAIRRRTELPMIIKLSPNVPNLCDVAKAAEDSGADAINMGNTHGPGMIINIETREPILDFKVGGVSGPGIRPITVRCVYDLYKVMNIPIIGTGGVTTWKDAIEMMMAGASAVGIGTAVYYEGVGVFKNISEGMAVFMQKEGYKNIRDLIGVAHHE